MEVIYRLNFDEMSNDKKFFLKKAEKYRGSTKNKKSQECISSKLLSII